MQLIRNQQRVTIEHTNSIIDFGIGVYQPTKYKNNFTVFDEINRYLAGLPDNRQVAIFNTYAAIRQAISEARQVDDEIVAKLRSLVADLYRYLDIDSLDRWVRNNGVLRLPATADDKLSDDLEERRTFLSEDYRNLGTFTIALRLMIPVWGEYQDLHSASRKGNNKSKEFASLKLLTESALYRHPSVNRVMTYIEATVEAVGGSVSALVSDGLGTSFLPEYLLAGAIVRRIAVAPLNEDLDRGGLAKNIHGFVHSALRDFDSSVDRVSINNGGGGDSETGEDFSHMERLRLKPTVPPGTLQKYRSWIDLVGPVGVAHSIDPTVPVELIMDCVNTNTKLEYVTLERCQLTLLKWMINKSIPAGMIDTINHQRISKALLPGVQAVLIHWGFIDLALLLTAEATTGHVTGHTSYQRVTKNTLKSLSDMFPYQSTRTSSKNNRQPNVAYEAINILTHKFTEHQWITSAPQTVVALQPNINALSIRIAPADINERLAQLTLKIWS